MENAESSIPGVMKTMMDLQQETLKVLQGLQTSFDGLRVDIQQSVIRNDEGPRNRGPPPYPPPNNGRNQPPLNPEIPIQHEFVDSSNDEFEIAENVGRRHQHGRNFNNRPNFGRAGGNFEYQLKMDLPTFNGQLHIEEFLDWLNEVERFFVYMEIPEDKKVKLVAYKLKGGASAWWEQEQMSRVRMGKTPIRSWRRMKQLLKGNFLPRDYDQILFQQYQNCQQGSRSVREYATDFFRLSTRNNLFETESQRAARFIGGLNPNIQDKMGIQDVWDLSEAIRLATKAEIQCERNSGRGQQPYKQYSGESSRGNHIQTKGKEGINDGKQPESANGMGRGRLPANNITQKGPHQ